MAQKTLSAQPSGKTWIARSVISSEEVAASDTRTEYMLSCSAGLTRRELELLQLVAIGLSNAEIASRLKLTSATITSYLNTIYSKLGVRSRTAAMRYAIDHHLCSTPSRKNVSPEERAVTHACSAGNATRKVGLTRREMEVLLLVSAGLSNAEIADRLVITLATVFGYLNDIYKKLGVSSRTAAMRYAIDNSLC